MHNYTERLHHCWDVGQRLKKRRMTRKHVDMDMAERIASPKKIPSR